MAACVVVSEVVVEAFGVIVINADDGVAAAGALV